MRTTKRTIPRVRYFVIPDEEKAPSTPILGVGVDFRSMRQSGN
jgi:hypothetical protein